MADLHQSKEWADFLTSQSWIVEDLNGAKAYIRKLPLCGSVIKIQRPQIIPPIEKIDKLARKYHAFFLKLEPDVSDETQKLGYRGFELDKTPSLPTRTLVIDLNQPLETIFANFSKGARCSIRKAEKAKISVTSYQTPKIKEQLKTFHQLLRATSQRQGFWSPNFRNLLAKAEAFDKKAILFLAFQAEDYPLAGIFTLVHNGTIYCQHAASSIKGRELSASYLLIWKIIEKAKKLNLNNLDLEGTYDPRYHRATKSWQKFSVFKKKWRGRKVEYPPPLIKYYHPAVKLIFRLDSLLFN